MTGDQADARASYPYMSASQWFGIRTKFRQSLPSIVDLDWIVAALGTSEKGARNILPQLKGVGVIAPDGKPVSALVQDLRDDETYKSACQQIVEKVYPSGLRESWANPDDDPAKVANWFMRNAGTGAQTAKVQAKLYLVLLSGELPTEDTAKPIGRKPTPTPAKKAAVLPPVAAKSGYSEAPREEHPVPPTTRPTTNLGPNLHVDVQIHISSDASDAQIESIFRSMAKHLYGRE